MTFVHTNPTIYFHSQHTSPIENATFLLVSTVAASLNFLQIPGSSKCQHNWLEPFSAEHILSGAVSSRKHREFPMSGTSASFPRLSRLYHHLKAQNGKGNFDFIEEKHLMATDLTDFQVRCYYQQLNFSNVQLSHWLFEANHKSSLRSCFDFIFVVGTVLEAEYIT